MKRARVIRVEGDEATVVFYDMGLQRKVQIMDGVDVEAGDTAVVLFSGDLSDCVLIGVVS